MGERVLASCVRQQRLIDALLKRARIGRGLTRREPVELAAIAATALRGHDPGELGSVVALEPVRTTGDPDLLEQLAANLVSNAIRHNIVGGRIEVATRAQPGRAVLTVANTGPRIPASELQRLFQPFQRLAPHLPDTTDGVGLGLTIAQTIADAHRAVMTARARAGGGLEIHVSFRRRPGTAASRPDAAEPSTSGAPSPERTVPADSHSTMRVEYRPKARPTAPVSRPLISL